VVSDPVRCFVYALEPLLEQYDRSVIEDKVLRSLTVHDFPHAVDRCCVSLRFSRRMPG
jgi:hypothetical protein